jgi:hypothetical protein
MIGRKSVMGLCVNSMTFITSACALRRFAGVALFSLCLASGRRRA